MSILYRNQVTLSNNTGLLQYSRVETVAERMKITALLFLCIVFWCFKFIDAWILIGFFLEPVGYIWRLSYYRTILYCILGVLKKSFEPAMKGSSDGKAGEYLVSYNIELLLLCVHSQLFGLLIVHATHRILVKASIIHTLTTKIWR